MAGDLIVRLAAAEDGDCLWHDDDGIASGHGSLSAAAEAAADRRVHLLVPGAEVLITRVAVPVTQYARARAAIPWALEDRLVDDVESLHFALGRHHDTGEWSVAVVARRTLDAWLERCAKAGIQPVSVRPAPLALPLPEAQEWVALEEAGSITVRTADDGGFTCEPGMLALVARAREKPSRIRRLGAATAEWPAELAPVLGAPEPIDDPAAAFTGAGGIELLQGAYSRRERAGRQLRRWRLPALIGVALLMVVGIDFALEYAALGTRETQLRERMQATFQQTFPDVQQVQDPRAQMAARLRSLRGDGGSGSGFAELLARAGSVLAEGSGARLTGLTWRGDTLELEVAADDLQVLDRIQRGFTEVGLAAELRGADRGDDGIDGRISVTEGGA